MVGLLKVLKIAYEVAEVVIPMLGFFGKKRAQKKAKQTEQVLEAVISGVQRYKDAPVSLPASVTTVIQEVAQSIPGVEERLNKFVKRVKAKLGK